LHSHIRLLARNDQRECSVARVMIRSLAEHMFLGGAHEGLPTPSHRSARGETVLPPCAFVEPLIRLPDVFRHFIALVRVVTECVEFAAWAPDLLQPPGDSRHRFHLGQMSPHMLTKWPPLASRTAQFLSTQNARISSTSGMSNARRWLGASLLRDNPGRGQADDD
jgi:hypothetical protein